MARHDTERIVEYIRENIRTKYLDGEITSEEYERAMSEFTAEDELADDVETMKAKKYEALQEKYFDGEITEEELESKMDRLFDSGDDFLEADTSEPRVNTSNFSFRAREIGQILLYLLATFIGGYAVFMTKGMVLPLLIPIGVAVAFYKSGYFR